MTLMNPKLDTDFVAWPAWWTVFWLSFFNTFLEGNNCRIIGPKYKILSVPWKTDLTFGIANSELICKL